MTRSRISHLQDTNCYFLQRWDSTETSHKAICRMESSDHTRWITMGIHSFSSRRGVLSLPADQNPNVVDSGGHVQPKLDPFGPIGRWQTAGRICIESLLMKRLQDRSPRRDFVRL